MKIDRRSFVKIGLGGTAMSLLSGSVSSVRASPYAPPNLYEWLNANPNVRDSISWLVPNTKTFKADKQSFQAWVTTRKDELVKAFEAAWNNQPSNASDLPTNLEVPSNFPATVIPPDQAWSYFKASVAQSLAIEIGNRVPWSVRTYPSEALSVLFDAEKLYMWDNSLDGYRVISDNGYFTPSPPELSLKFLNQIGAVSIPGLGTIPGLKTVPKQTGRPQNPLSLPTAKNARVRTIARLFDWSRYYLLHFAGDYTTENMKAHWQYAGMPPLSRVINGTINQTQTLKEVGHWTAGCFGTTGFLSGVLRAVNIPVQQKFTCQHSLAHFVADDLYLTHSDDLYNLLSKPASDKSNVPFPSAELLISSNQYKTWFGTNCNNVGRNPAELAVKYLSPLLVQYYVADKSGNKSHAGGKVYEALKKFYTVTELENLKLWERLEAKVSGM